ncbi:MAG: NeuD/PglB/VioB family sugar acetyltransferase [Alphaproteobacteria bacterium]|nr:NeuD/PglB/VioB family sugar acetyltransferase [Alphaproteobacteria bacterium]
MPKALKSLVIIGAGGHAKSVADAAMSAGYKIACFVAPDAKSKKMLGIPVQASMPKGAGYVYALALGDNAKREAVAIKYAKLVFPTIVHKTAYVSPSAKLGAGTVVLAQANVGADSKVGRFCIINSAASLDHDGVLGDFAALAPAATTGGNVTIGARVAIGIGAAIKHGISIGDDCVLGAKSYLDRDLPKGVVAYGAPAKAVRKRKKGDAYL